MSERERLDPARINLNALQATLEQTLALPASFESVMVIRAKTIAMLQERIEHYKRLLNED